MTCQTPDLSSHDNLTEVNWPVFANVSFIMDAVGGLVTGQRPMVRYFQDPVVEHFDGDDQLKYLYDDDMHLEIKVRLFLVFISLYADRGVYFSWVLCPSFKLYIFFLFLLYSSFFFSPV